MFVIINELPLMPASLFLTQASLDVSLSVVLSTELPALDFRYGLSGFSLKTAFFKAPEILRKKIKRNANGNCFGS